MVSGGPHRSYESYRKNAISRGRTPQSRESYLARRKRAHEQRKVARAAVLESQRQELLDAVNRDFAERD